MSPLSSFGRGSKGPAGLPGYLTSGASSRGHHALLARLHEAASPQEEDEIITEELRRCRGVLGQKGQTTAKVAETLIIVLHCAMIRHSTSDNLGFANIAALQLAESGKTIKERRIGYLYLCERLKEDDELYLMLINTIRKDLSSEDPHNILLALNTVAALPSHDLVPAITPLLISRRLLRHELPSVRQRTILALQALHIRKETTDVSLSSTISPRAFPIEMDKLLKLLLREKDESVIAALLKLITSIIEDHIYFPKDQGECGQFIKSIMMAAGTDSPLQPIFGAINCLSIIMRVSADRIDKIVRRQVDDWFRAQLDTSFSQATHRAVLLEICQCVATTDDKWSSGTMAQIVKMISSLLHPPSSSSSSSMPRPNDHVLALRCLTLLPVDMWDSALDESDMRVIMEGINSPDMTIRRMTLRLLYRLSPDLLQTTFGNHLQSLRESEDLALPFNLPNNAGSEDKLRLAQYETAARALEAAEVMLDQEDLDGTQDGTLYAEKILACFDALDHAQENTKAIWHEGIRLVLDYVQTRGAEFQKAFTASFSTNGRVGDNIAVIRATALSQYPISPDQVSEAANSLSQGLSERDGSIQELVLISLLSLCSRLQGQARDYLSETLRSAIDSLNQSSKYIRKRCKQISDIMDNDLLEKVSENAKSSSLPDILNALLGVHASYRAKHPTSRSSTPASASQPSTSAAHGNQRLSSSLSPSALRYDAYDAPSQSSQDRSQVRAAPSNFQRTGNAVNTSGSKQSRPRVSFTGLSPGEMRRYDTSTSMQAGDYALFDADELEDEEQVAAPARNQDDGGTPNSQIDNDPTLVSLSLDEDRETQQGSPSDPFSP